MRPGASTDCAVCGVTLPPQKHVGRTRLYCSNACKVARYKGRPRPWWTQGIVELREARAACQKSMARLRAMLGEAV